MNGFGDENGGLFKLISISPSDILGRYPVGNLVRSSRVTTQQRLYMKNGARKEVATE